MRRCETYILTLYKSEQLPGRRHGAGAACVNCLGEIGRNATVRLRSKGEGETAREHSNFRDRKRSHTSHIGLDKQGYVNRSLSRQNPPHDAWQLRWWVVQPVEAQPPPKDHRQLA